MNDEREFVVSAAQNFQRFNHCQSFIDVINPTSASIDFINILTYTKNDVRIHTVPFMLSLPPPFFVASEIFTFMRP